MPRRRTKTTVGDLNLNRQRLIGRTSQPGGDREGYLWIIECARLNGNGEPCGHRYGFSGAGFFQRKCPVCQGGQPALAFEAAW